MRERLSMDYGWKFHLGDIIPTKPNWHLDTYFATKAGGALGAAAHFFDDSAWRELDIPHDWAIEMPYDETENINHGFKPRGIAWYRKTFKLPEELKDRQLYLEFGSVLTHCEVWVNGQPMHRNHCGYTGFIIDITSMANFGSLINTAAVRVDAEAFEAWSYEGAGINRHIDLHITDKLHIKPQGVYVKPIKTGGRPAYENGCTWDTEIEITIRNAFETGCQAEVRSEIIGADGITVASASSHFHLEAGNESVVSQNIPVTDPNLWSVDSPALYTLRTTVFIGSKSVDEVNTVFGYRTIHFDANEGFFLNDKSFKIKGTCNHQDHAGLGAALPDTMHEFRISKLKEMGCNAYRCAHHPPASELLDACDRLGMLVMDENRNFGDSPEIIAQLETMVRRDRNHPSVIMWSIFNEEMIQTTSAGRKIALNMVRAVKKLDTSRPVTAAMNAVVSDDAGVTDVVDVVGINYFQGQYDDFHNLFPDKPILGSENNCTYGTRGIYKSDTENRRFADNDTESTEFGELARKSWSIIDSRPFMAGIFVWTGFDYKGEPYPYKWPVVSSNHGNLDVCGFPKSGFYLHQALWTDEPMIHIHPYWNLPEGSEVTVRVYTNCEEAELFQDGLSLGKKSVDRYEMASWDVVYSPGCLHAIGYTDGSAKAETSVETSGKPSALLLEPWRSELASDGVDTIPVTVRAVDENGRFVPNAMDTVDFQIIGGGKIPGVGNGDNTCHEPDKAERRSLFNGLCQVIVQSGFEAGEITLSASARGMKSAELTIPCVKAERKKYIPSEKYNRFVTGWRKTPITQEKPDINLKLETHDMNSWLHAETGNGEDNAFAANPGYSLYRATFDRPSLFSPFVLDFEGIAGAAEIYADKVLVAVKSSCDEESVTVTSPATGSETATIDVIIDGRGGHGGITKTVKITS